MSIRGKILGTTLFVTMLGMVLGVSGLISARLSAVKTSELRAYSARSHEFTPILNAHYSWRNELTDAVLINGEFKGSLDPKTCALGKWLNSEAAKALTDARVIELLSRISDPHDFIHHEAGYVISYLNAGDKDNATSYLVDRILPRCDEVISSLLEINERYAELIDTSEAEAANLAKASTMIITILIIISMSIGVFLALFVAGRISKPLVVLSNSMKNAGATGDITLRPEDVEVIGKFAMAKDEVGQTIEASASFVRRIADVSEVLTMISKGDLTHDVELLSEKDKMGIALHDLYENLNKMIGEVRISADQVSLGAERVAKTAASIAASSQQMASGAQSLAEGATKQAASMEDVSKSIAEIAEKTTANADMADQAVKLTDIIINNAEKGSRQMKDMVVAVNDINEASKSVSNIMETISGIAAQTNLLALNAAIEAARAGEHGRGFAVVAEEVRKLAAQSEEAVKETSVIINSSMEKAEQGAKAAGEMNASLTEIVAGINESNQLITKIAEASEGQSSSIAQINTNITQVAEITRHNSALAEESAASAEESAAASAESTVAADQMSANSETLEELVSQFKLKNGKTRE
jgi:methyl-accepting chemotaxis protein